MSDEDGQTPVPQLRGGASAPHHHLGIPLFGGFPADSSCWAREATQAHTVPPLRGDGALRVGGARTLPGTGGESPQKPVRPATACVYLYRRRWS